MQGSNGDADRENRLSDIDVGEGEGGMDGESSRETYTLPHVKRMTSRNLLSDSGNSNHSSVTTQRAGMGWEVGGRGHMYTYG